GGRGRRPRAARRDARPPQGRHDGGGRADLGLREEDLKNEAGFDVGIKLDPEQAEALGIVPFGDGGADDAASPRRSATPPLRLRLRLRQARSLAPLASQCRWCRPPCFHRRAFDW
ncbi:unnamed protein product, partial [Prorocentrum cordatum]